MRCSTYTFLGALCVMNAKLPSECSVTPAEVLPCTQRCLEYTFEYSGNTSAGVTEHPLRGAWHSWHIEHPIFLQCGNLVLRLQSRSKLPRSWRLSWLTQSDAMYALSVQATSGWEGGELGNVPRSIQLLKNPLFESFCPYCSIFWLLDCWDLYALNTSLIGSASFIQHDSSTSLPWLVWTL